MATRPDEKIKMQKMPLGFFARVVPAIIRVLVLLRAASIIPPNIKRGHD
jgi:hypothetical protein